MASLVFAFAILTAGATSASAQGAKEIKTKKGVSVALVNLLNAKRDCSANMNPVSLPVVRDKPAHGTIQMTVLVARVDASADCPVRQVPVITLIYVPSPLFTGSDAVTIEVDDRNKTTMLSYKIAVQAPGDSL